VPKGTASGSEVQTRTGETDLKCRRCYRREKNFPDGSLISIVQRHAGKSSPSFRFQCANLLEIERFATSSLGSWKMAQNNVQEILYEEEII
jgi:hypothetical protein